MGKPVFSASTGRRLGTVRDLYVDLDLTTVVGIYLGSEGLLSRKEHWIDRGNVSLFGVDTILATGDDVLADGDPAREANTWLRRDALGGRPIRTEGGTQVGTVSDIILDEAMQLIGVQLGRVYVEGPLSDKRAIVRDAITDVGNEGSMIVDLAAAEHQELHAI